MHVLLERQVFGGGERNFWRDQTLHNRIVCEVQKHGYVVSNAAFFKGTAEEVGYVVFDAHGGKYDGKLFIGIIPREACFTIWAASWSWGSPFPEKIGSFCPRISVVRAVNCGDSGVDIVFSGIPA